MPSRQRRPRADAAQVERRGASTPKAQQRELDKWRQEFNHVRPHQALAGKTPSEVYKPTSKRPAVARRYRYPSTMSVVRVFKNGNFRLRGDAYFLSTALAGMLLGLEPIDALHQRVWLHDLELGVIEVAPQVSPALYNPVSTSRAAVFITL